MIDPACVNAAEAPADQAYENALARGWQAMKAHTFDRAADAFTAAVEARPCDARALSELSWAAFRAGQMDRAKAAAKKANGATDNPELRASALYNLGRVYEWEGAFENARVAYRESVALRANGTVERRLASLRPAKPLHAQPIIGPLKSSDTYCENHGRQSAEYGDDPVTCYSLPPDTEPELAKPFVTLELGFVENEHTRERRVDLLITTSRGVFGRDGLTQGEPGYEEFLVVDIAVRHGVLWFRYRTMTQVRGWVDDEETMRGWVEEDSEVNVILCGEGRSGGVSCLTPITTETKTPDGDLKPILELEPRAGNRLIVRATKNDLDPAHAFVGLHELVFP